LIFLLILLILILLGVGGYFGYMKYMEYEEQKSSLKKSSGRGISPIGGPGHRIPPIGGPAQKPPGPRRPYGHYKPKHGKHSFYDVFGSPGPGTKKTPIKKQTSSILPTDKKPVVMDESKEKEIEKYIALSELTKDQKDRLESLNRDQISRILKGKSKDEIKKTLEEMVKKFKSGSKDWIPLKEMEQKDWIELKASDSSKEEEKETKKSKDVFSELSNLGSKKGSGTRSFSKLSEITKKEPGSSAIDSLRDATKKGKSIPSKKAPTKATKNQSPKNEKKKQTKPKKPKKKAK